MIVRCLCCPLIFVLLQASICAEAIGQEDQAVASGPDLPAGKPENVDELAVIGENTDTGIYTERVFVPMVEVPITAPLPLPLVDRTQQSVYEVVNASSMWFDSFFGTPGNDAGQNVRQGSVRLGTQWDERDGVKLRARFKARLPLPAMRERGRLILGRGDADDFVDGTSTGTADSLPNQFNDFEDDDWLLGVGYSKGGSLSRGFDLGVGLKVATPLEPYVRVTYRWNHAFNDAWLWQLRPRVFYQSQRGQGGSLNSILDYAVNSAWLLRSWIILSAEDEIAGMGWENNLIAYQSLTNKTALSYSIYAAGQTEDEVTLHDYGFELRFRRRIAREYLFLELSTGISWPRYLVEERRESNFGFGIEFEMQFGDWPGRTQAR
jgi:hypothetical protein